LDEFATSIKFKSNRFSFATGVASKLDAIVSVMKNFEKAKFSVEGYTDSVGAASYNQKLSEKRANAVMKYLVSHGISADRLTAKGYGEANPIASNMNRAGRAANRRVEIKVVNKE